MLNLTPHHPINNKSEGEDGEVQGRIVVMNVGDTSHGDEWHVVEEPSNYGVDTSIKDVVDVVLLEFVIAPLPANKVPGYQEAENTERGRGTPVYQRVSE